MSAYAALVSLMQIIHEIKNHPSSPISIHKQQLESLTENVTFLQEFLECYDSPFAYKDEADPLEIRITDAVHAAEDVIESGIVDRIHTRSTIRWKLMWLSDQLFRGMCKCAAIEGDDDFYHDLHQVIEEMNVIKKEAMEIIAQKPGVVGVQRGDSSTRASSSSTVKESVMVGFDQVLLEVLDKLTRGQLNRQIIPIMGMGGIGKTTLARNLFENAFTKEHFDIRVWTAISQVYNTRETLGEILSQATGDSSVVIGENDLGESLYKYLSGRRYLIVMDDIWSLEAWEKMKFFFPDYNNGSRILVTTRLSNLASRLSESYGVGMKFLDEDSSWDLFCKTVFGKESVPRELENVGKKIVANCRGLPLSVATIGGLLAKSERTREYWKRIKKNISSIVITNNDEFCLKILKTSYVNLPNYLKPCFLYMGVFEEDSRIRVSILKKLWVSEGFLKPISGKSLETVAEQYLNELVSRNLVLVHELGSGGNVKFCKIHDLLRDLCLREVANEGFVHVLDSLNSSSCARAQARSLICDDIKVENSDNLRLLRTLKACPRVASNARRINSLGDVFQLVNLRYLAVGTHTDTKFPRSINLLWNLQTLIIDSWHAITAPVGIWKMHQLRHVEFTCCRLRLPDPPSDDIVIMENLQTLTGVRDLYLDANVVKRIPNIKKLDVECDGEGIERGKCLSHLECLSKLEMFRCSVECKVYLQKISFPRSLKELKPIVFMNSIDFEELNIMRKLGSLPLLRKLALCGDIFKRGKWETTEGQFPCLKLLDLSSCRDLNSWTVSDKSHFPLLQELHLTEFHQLKEIPEEIGEIATLKLIDVYHCCKSLVLSAKKIMEEQEDLYGEEVDLIVNVRCRNETEANALQYLTTPNFHVSD